MSQGALFDAIRAVSFTMDELRLFLDTHPDNSDALKIYLDNQARRHDLIAEYTNKYGPVEAYCINNDGSWSWTNEPMPWKAEAN